MRCHSASPASINIDIACDPHGLRVGLNKQFSHDQPVSAIIQILDGLPVKAQAARGSGFLESAY